MAETEQDKNREAILQISEHIHQYFRASGMPSHAQASVATSLVVEATQQMAREDFPAAIKNVTKLARIFQSLSETKSPEEFAATTQFLSDAPRQSQG